MHRARKTGPSLLVAAIVAASLLFTNCHMSNKTDDTTNSGASANANDPLSIHRRAISIDMHADTTQRLVDEGLDLEDRLTDGHLDAVRMKEGGLDAQFFSIWVEPQLYGG
ncbi:MAG: hypothetical protein WCF57_05715, partial [Pyrinomonadaceae bacterium]